MFPVIWVVIEDSFGHFWDHSKVCLTSVTKVGQLKRSSSGCLYLKSVFNCSVHLKYREKKNKFENNFHGSILVALSHGDCFCLPKLLDTCFWDFLPPPFNTPLSLKYQAFRCQTRYAYKKRKCKCCIGEGLSGACGVSTWNRCSLTLFTQITLVTVKYTNCLHW